MDEGGGRQQNEEQVERFGAVAVARHQPGEGRRQDQEGCGEKPSRVQTCIVGGATRVGGKRSRSAQEERGDGGASQQSDEGADDGPQDGPVKSLRAAAQRPTDERASSHEPEEVPGREAGLGDGVRNEDLPTVGSPQRIGVERVTRRREGMEPQGARQEVEPQARGAPTCTQVRAGEEHGQGDQAERDGRPRQGNRDLGQQRRESGKTGGKAKLRQPRQLLRRDVRSQPGLAVAVETRRHPSAWPPHAWSPAGAPSLQAQVRRRRRSARRRCRSGRKRWRRRGRQARRGGRAGLP